MRTKVLSSILFLTIITISCELLQQNEYYHLDSSYRSLLKTGDTLVYVDCNSKTDTFLVFRKISGTDRTSLSGSNCQYDPSAFFDIELLYLQRKKEKMWEPHCLSSAEVTDFGDCGSEYDCDQTIFIMVSAGVTDKKTQLRTDTKPFILWYGNPIKFDTFINSMTVYGIKYDSVFYYKSDNIQKTDSIQGIYCTYKYGIIQMDLINGNVLELVKK